MNGLKVNYIQVEKCSMFGCSQRVRVLLFEMLSKCMFREPKSAEEGKDYLEKDKQNRQQ